MRTAPPPAPLRPALAALAVALTMAGCANTSEEPRPDQPPGEAREAASGPDFDGDGYDDLAVTVPGATVDGRARAGSLVIVPGSADGPVRDAATVLTRASEGVPGETAVDDLFGDDAVSGDFDGDGLDDLLVGAIGGDEGQGSVLFRGSAEGLGTGTRTDLSPDSVAAVGDVNADGHLDAVQENLYEDGQTGMLLRYGPFSGDGVPADEQTVLSGSDADQRVIAGDLDGDGVDDLVAFRAFEEMAHPTFVWRGTPSGPELLEGGDRLPTGDAGTIADVDGDGYGDLVMRSPGGNVENPPHQPGEIVVVHGSPEGPGERIERLTLDTEGVPEGEADGDQFGHVLVSGDVDGDGYADVMAGMTRDGSWSLSRFDAGDVVLLRGGPDGLTGAGARVYGPEDAGAPLQEPGSGPLDESGHPRTQARVLDTDGDGLADLAVAGPTRPYDGVPAPVWTLRGTGQGLEGQGSFTMSDLGAPTDPGTGLGHRPAR